jgi:hypothetical protein
MPDALQPFKELDGREQAVRFHGRERRRSLAGIPELFRTHRIYGGTTMAVAEVSSALFPIRHCAVTFKTAIRITENAGVHRGTILELGGNLRGVGLWVEDEKIGVRAGGILINGNAAFGEFDNGAELPPGLELELVLAICQGFAALRLWGNGRLLVRAAASAGTFAGDWAGQNNGAFAAEPFGSTVPEIPAGSAIAPDGFEVIEPLSVYMGQRPRHFSI